jgi:hypothetical protein
VIEADVLSAAAELVGEAPAGIELVRGGGNNRLYRVRGRRESYALKRYPDDRADARERYEREYAALSLLARHGERRVPRPLALDAARHLALYSWVDGVRVGERTPGDVRALAAFARRLHELRDAEGADGLALAREAVLSPADLRAQLAARVTRLRAVLPDHPELRDLVDEIERLAAAGTVDAAPLERAYQTLSPSDFGLHNALRTADGLVFLDFEYFGWDDPVKLVADVLWHPGMNLDRAEGQEFFDGVADVYGVDRSFRIRFERDVPLYGLRWALIVLNEFLPAMWRRRVDAGEQGSREAVLAVQFAKAKRLVERARAGSPLAC